MDDQTHRAIAIVGLGAILPDAPDVPTFWENLRTGRYSIADVPADRWDPALYYDANPAAPDKTYSKIGAWVRSCVWDPTAWKLPIPPRVADAMDWGQKWAVACTRQALLDYGWPSRALDVERTAVVLGNAMAGEKHYRTALRIEFPEVTEELRHAPSFAALPAAVQQAIREETHGRIARRYPEITEDTMPGELGNCIAGRIANLFNLRGPNFIVDAACASAMAAISAAAQGLVDGDFDAVLSGGIDRNMGASTFVKFCKIGALSATGTRPYADGADGFVMGEGAVVFLLKRLADAERAGDRVYAVLRGVAGSSDGKGKGITAPNPAGQRLAIARAWRAAGLAPQTATLVEGHGTSTRVGDAVELEALAETFAGTAVGTIALGSVKSNIGHLKGAAGAAGLLKTVLALHHRTIPPSLNWERPNPQFDFARSPFRVATALRPWDVPAGAVRRAGVSAFGFGGTNFHTVLEEFQPGRLGGERPRPAATGVSSNGARTEPRTPLRGALVLGAATPAELATRLAEVGRAAAAGRTPAPAAPAEADLRAAERLAIDYGDAAELAAKAEKASKALATDAPAGWKALGAQGIFRGRGPAGKVAFLYTGQGSQYVNMLAGLRAAEPVVAETFAAADATMTPLLDAKPLSAFIFVDGSDSAAVAGAESALMQTEITQPAVLTVDAALTRLLATYGVVPDMVMGHSLGEYGALVAAGALPFGDALEAVSARGREMAHLTIDDNGAMAAVSAPPEEIEAVLSEAGGYVVIANKNSRSQNVIGGATAAVERAMQLLQARGRNVVRLPVSHAFHTRIVAPASEPLRTVLARLRLQAPEIPLVANVDGEPYPVGPDARARMIDILARQVASPVEFVKGLETLYANGARVFVEVGPKRALQGFAEDVLGDRADVLTLFTNHPKVPDATAFNQALCGLYAAGLGIGERATDAFRAAEPVAPASVPATTDTERLLALGRLSAEFLQRASALCQAGPPSSAEPVVITGAALGLPGTERIFDDGNLARLLEGEELIDVIPVRLRHAILDKHITRLVKSDEGGARFETIERESDVVKLAARGRAFDLEREFGVPAERVAALDRVSQLAIAAGIDALRDAGIPLVMRYRTTTKGTRLPERWELPETLRDDTGVIFASCFPGYDAFANDLARYHGHRARADRLAMLEHLRTRLLEGANGHDGLRHEVDRLIDDVRAEMAREPFAFDRRFLFRVLAMGHSQFAELIGARGPNTQLNAACASTTQAIGIASDWIRTGRCRRVVIVAADDVTSDGLLEWFGSGFLSTGAAATDDVVEDAALPFDRRRHGMILGMGAAALVVESAEAARERAITPICEVLGAAVANSAFHGTRLDVEHIADVMEGLVASTESRTGLRRDAVAHELVFVSHETYTPARGGSAAAEVNALRRVFGAGADRIVVANTKGFTGHPMGVGIEDVVAVKALETGIVPPVANFKEIDPDLGPLRLSRGGFHPVEYALRLGAGFGSQIGMTLLRRIGAAKRPALRELGYAYRIAEPTAWRAWLTRVTGDAAPELEVVQHALRVKDRGTVARPTAPVAEIPAASAPAPTPPIAPAPPPPAAAAAMDAVRERVLAIVAGKTGYPPDMLDVDLDLEADLGIDTVKQAETFAAVRQAYDIPRDDKLKLRDFPTLAHVIRFVRDRRPDLAAALPVSPPASPATAAAASDTVRETVLGIVAEKTGYPPDMLDVDLDLEADLGIDTVKQAETFAAVRQAYDIPRDDKLKLRDFPTLAHVIRFVRARRPDLAEPPAARPSSASAATDGTADAVRETILRIVAEKTGYPPDMLDVDLDLEADLGVDTVKQAETFAAVRQAYDIPRDDKLKLRDFPTLAHVIRFVLERRADLGGASVLQPAAAATNGGPPGPEAADRVPRRIPVAAVRPPLDVCKPTGATLAAGTRVVVMADRGGVADALVSRLAGTGIEVLRLDGAPTAADLGGRIASWRAAGPVHGLYWLPALDAEPPIADMDLAGWREALRVRAKLLFAALRALDTELAQPGRFLVAGTRLGGRHGYDSAGAFAPMGGAVTGLVKAYRRERETLVAKAVDFAASAPAADVAEALVSETLADPGAVEVGRAEGVRWTVALDEAPAADGRPGLTLGRDSVFVVTGAAGSIVSAIVADLAAASGGTFHLLDRVPTPDPTNPDLARFATDRDGLKRELFERLKARGERATPVMVERELAGLERLAAARSAIDAVHAAGGTPVYHQVDLTDAASVAAAMEDVRRSARRVDVLVHAAGLEVSRLVADKPPEEFERVFDVKADGWFNVVHAIGDAPLGAAVVFSSIAGRFGNRGQTDYSAANDLLCKQVSRLRPTRGIAIDWTAWSGIGMASRGSIPQMMELAGIDMLPPDVGVPVVRRELTGEGTRGEVVIAGRLGALAAEWDPTGGLDPVRAAATAGTAGPMIGTVAGMPIADGLVIETRLDPREQPFLNDHRIDGVAVLPGVMGIEAFAEAATLLFPSWRVTAIEEVDFLAPLKFYRDEPRTVTITAFLRASEGGIVATCRLIGTRQLPGQPEPQRTVHFVGRVRLAPATATLGSRAVPASPDGGVPAAEIYRVYFHGPAYRVLDRVWRAGDRTVGALAGSLPPDHVPPDYTMRTTPRLVEACFQAAGLAEIGRTGRMGLPSHVGLLRVAGDGTPAGALVAVAPAAGDTVDVDVVAPDGQVLVQLRGYRTALLPDPIAGDDVRVLRSALEG